MKHVATLCIRRVRARVGVVPGWRLGQTLSRLIGVSRAKDLSLSGNFLDAATAAYGGRAGVAGVSLQRRAVSRKYRYVRAFLVLVAFSDVKRWPRDEFWSNFEQKRAASATGVRRRR